MEKRNIYIIAGVIGVVLAITGITLANTFTLPEEKVVDDIKVDVLDEDIEEDEEVEERESFIDGEKIKVEEEKMIAVVVENHGESRKQMSGLSEASLVFETETEGGITRFLAFFPYQSTERVGPVRSARPYLVKWAEMFNSAFVHAGGSDAGLSEIYNSGRVYDMDGLALEGGTKYFVRDYAYYAPHNLFANLDDLREMMDTVGWDKPIKTAFFNFGDSEVEELEDTEEINIYYPFPNYYVKFRYNSAKDTYERSQGGEKHIDSNNGKQIEVSNVVILLTDYYPIDEEGRLYMKVDGVGDMFLFRNGKVFAGTWEKLNSLDEIKLYDENDKEMKLEKGKTWVSVFNYPEGLKWD